MYTSRDCPLFWNLCKFPILYSVLASFGCYHSELEISRKDDGHDKRNSLEPFYRDHAEGGTGGGAFCKNKNKLNKKIIYSSVIKGTFNLAVITNKERRDLLKFLITFPNKMKNLLYLVGKLCIIFTTFF